MEEIWKDIPGYEGSYQVSNLGRVKSLPRIISNGKCFYLTKEKCIKNIPNTNGYLAVSLYKDKKAKKFMVHQIIYLSFKNIASNRKYVIDHIDNNKLNNQLNNLQLVTNRYNSIKDKKSKSKEYDIYLNGKSYLIRMRINNRKYSIGTYKKIEDAIYYRDYFIKNILININEKFTVDEIKQVIEKYKQRIKRND
jgi:hypothetical protein